MNVAIADRLAAIRRKNKLSQEDLAAKIGVSRQAISKWERAEASPDTDNLLLLANLYHVTLDELLRTDLPMEEFLQQEPEIETSTPDNTMPFMEAADEEPKPQWETATPPPPPFTQTPNYTEDYTAYQQTPGSKEPEMEKNPAYRTWMCFPFPVLITGIYLILGFLFNLWHPAWLLFLTVPFYYTTPLVPRYRPKNPEDAYYSGRMTPAESKAIAIGVIFGVILLLIVGVTCITMVRTRTETSVSNTTIEAVAGEATESELAAEE